MSLEEDVELLRTIPLFAKIEASKLKLLAFTSQRLTFGADLPRLLRQIHLGGTEFGNNFLVRAHLEVRGDTLGYFRADSRYLR